MKRCRISIDGHTEISFTEDVSKRFEALGWHVQHVKDGNTDLGALRSAIEAAKKDPRPSMIKVPFCPCLHSHAAVIITCCPACRHLQCDASQCMHPKLSSKQQTAWPSDSCFYGWNSFCALNNFC